MPIASKLQHLPLDRRLYLFISLCLELLWLFWSLKCDLCIILSERRWKICCIIDFLVCCRISRSIIYLLRLRLFFCTFIFDGNHFTVIFFNQLYKQKNTKISWIWLILSLSCNFLRHKFLLFQLQSQLITNLLKLHPQLLILNTQLLQYFLFLIISSS